MLTSLTRGSSVSAGSSARAISTFSRTSRNARSESNPASNSSVSEPYPSAAVARISLMPSIERSSFSIGRINRRSASSGEMPSWVMVTVMIGIGTSGSASLGID